MLFILIVETLAISIRNNKNTDGIQIDHNRKKITLKITQYADDTNHTEKYSYDKGNDVRAPKICQSKRP